MKLYNALGVSKDASPDEIRKAYKKLAVQHHPDKGGDETKFKEISAAYEILSDDGKRAQYNQIGDAGLENGGMQGGGGMPGGMNPHDIFAQMFGGGGGMPHHDPFGGFHFNMNMHHNMHQNQNRQDIRRSDNTHPIHISLAEAFHGIRKSIKLILTKTCCKCKTTCGDCQGVGMITEMHRVAIFTQMIQRPCGKCNGTGSMSNARKDCSECQGKCVYTEEKKQDIDIPKAVSHGHQIRLVGLGEQIQSSRETPGDLILQILIDEDKNFSRQNNDLIYKLTITFTESVIGKEITIPHFGGEIKMNIDTFGIIDPGKQYTVSGKGMTTQSNLILSFTVKYPNPKKSLNTDQKKQLEDMLSGLTI
jgi:DnaJ homolog subfamily A member 2